MTRLRIASLTAGVTALVALLVVAISSGGGPGTSHAEFNVVDPIPGEIENIAVDTEITGNTPKLVASVTECRVVAASAVFTIDIVVDEIAIEDGIGGQSFSLVYDPAILSVTGRAPGSAILFFQGPGNGSYNDTFSDALPDTDGSYRHEGIDLGGSQTPQANETGEGVVARLTITAVGLGTSVLDLTDEVEFDGTPNTLTTASVPISPNNVLDGRIVVGAGTCDATPTPSPTPPPTAEVVVAKNFTDVNPADVTVSLSCTGDPPQTNVDNTASESDPANFTVQFGAGTTCTATETVPEGYIANQTNCANLNVSATGTVNCTITNTPTSATVNVAKDFSDNNASAVTISLDCEGAATVETSIAGDNTASEADDANFLVTRFPVGGADCTATESDVPSGYAQTASTCEPVAIADGGTSNCTITNAPSSGTFTVTKDYVPNLAGNPVTVTLSCLSGTVAVNGLTAEEGAPAVFTVNTFDQGATCTATETGTPAGYEEDETDCAMVSLVNGGNAACTLLNQTYAQLHVAKDFSDDSTADVNVVLFGCDSGEVTVVDPTASEADTADFELRGFSPDASCTVTESPTPSGYDFDRDSVCNNWDPAPGDDTTCNITNTARTFTLTVDKVYSGGDGPAVTITVTCSDPAIDITSPAQADDPTPDAVFTLTYGGSGDTCDASEGTPPAGFTADESDCQDIDVDESPSTAESGSCTITNTLNTATVTVDKDFADDNPATVSVSLTCTSGTVTNSPQDASETLDAVFDVEGHSPGATCTATETGLPPGYNQVATTCAPTAAISTTGGNTNCTITNADATPTPRPTRTPIGQTQGPTAPPTPTFTPSPTPTPTPTGTPTATPTPTDTPTPSPIGQTFPPTTPRPTRTPVGGAPSVTPTPTATPAPTLTATPGTDTPAPTTTSSEPTQRPTRTPVPGGNSLANSLRGLSSIW